MNTLSIAILAGGKSRRMGQDKALVRLGELTLLEIVAEQVRHLTDDLFIVASHREGYDRFGFRVVPDVVPDAGSLGGIYSALVNSAHPFCLVVACDMPLINTELVSTMAALPRDYDVLVPVLPAVRSDQGGDQTFETLHAIYARSILPVLEGHIFNGQLKIAAVLNDLRVRRLDEATIRQVDPDLLSFFNVNTPEDLSIAREAIERNTQ